MEYGCIRLTPLEWSFFVLGLRLPRVELEVVAPVLALLHLEVYPSGFLGVLLEEGNELVDLDADLGFNLVAHFFGPGFGAEDADAQLEVADEAGLEWQ